MDNKTLALLGLGAALTAFLSHQSYQNTGSALAWTGFSDPPVSEATTLSDSEPEPVAEAAAASVSDTDNEPSFLKKIPLNCYRDCKKREGHSSYCNKTCFHDWYEGCYGDCFKEWLGRPGNEDLKSISETAMDTKGLYNHLDLLFPRCKHNKSNDYCPDKNAEDTGTTAQRQLAINKLFIAGMLSENETDRALHKLKLECIEPVNARITFIKRDITEDYKRRYPIDKDFNNLTMHYPSLDNDCESNEECSFMFFHWPNVTPINTKHLSAITSGKEINPGWIKDHTCNECGRCESAGLVGPHNEKIMFFIVSAGGGFKNPVDTCIKTEALCAPFLGESGRRKRCSVSETPMPKLDGETAAECEKKIHRSQRACGGGGAE